MGLTKTQKGIIVFAAVAVAIYFLYTALNQKTKRGADGIEGIPDDEGFYYFKYAGGSALREANGEMPDCNSQPGEPVPTDFYAFLEMGKFENGIFTPFQNANCTEDNLCRVIPQDQINGIEIIQGQNNSNLPLIGNSFDVLQLGTDVCTPGNEILYRDNGILIDLVVHPEGATDPVYSASGEVIGRFKLNPVT